MSGSCVDDTTVLGCGPTCETCGTPHASNTCDTSGATPVCTHTCLADYCDVGGTCLADNTVLGCGASCTACPGDPGGNGVAACDASGAAPTCVVTCNPGYCADSTRTSCVASDTTTDVNNCGGCGTVCPAHDANGNGTASCSNSTCGIDCGTGMTYVAAADGGIGFCQTDVTTLATEHATHLTAWAASGFGSSPYWINSDTSRVETGAGTVVFPDAGASTALCAQQDPSQSVVELAWADGTQVYTADTNYRNPIAVRTAGHTVANCAIQYGTTVSNQHVYWQEYTTTTGPGGGTEYLNYLMSDAFYTPGTQTQINYDPYSSAPTGVIFGPNNPHFLYYSEGFSNIEATDAGTDPYLPFQFTSSPNGQPPYYIGDPVAQMSYDDVNLYWATGLGTANNGWVFYAPFGYAPTTGQTLMQDLPNLVGVASHPSCTGVQAGHVWVAESDKIMDVSVPSGTINKTIYHPNITGVAAGCYVACGYLGCTPTYSYNVYFTTWDGTTGKVYSYSYTNP